MQTLTEPRPSEAPDATAELVTIHVVCCNPNQVALCGVTCTGPRLPAGDYGARDCVVCAALDAGGCPRCRQP